MYFKSPKEINLNVINFKQAHKSKKVVYGLAFTGQTSRKSMDGSHGSQSLSVVKESNEDIGKAIGLNTILK